MFIELSSAEEKLLKLIIENCDHDTKSFSFSTQLLPPELRFYKEAMQSLVAKGYVYKEMPVLRAVTGYATDEGLTYFIAKEQNKQMKPLKGEARDLLVELIENKDSDLAGLLAQKFKGLDFQQDTRLRATIKYLIDNGYLNIPKNGWADNVPYFTTLTFEGEHYLELEADNLQEKGAIPHTVNVSGGQVNIASGHATINANQYQAIDTQALAQLITSVKENAGSLPPADVEAANDSLEVIEKELVQQSPKKGFLRTALTALQAIKGTTEFAAAVAALVQFVQKIIA